MEITGTNLPRDSKVEKASRIKRSGQEKEGKKDNRRKFADILEQDMDEVELHESDSTADGDNLQVSTDTVSISKPGMVRAETKLASSDIVDLEATRKLAEKIKEAQPEKQQETTAVHDPDEPDPSVDTVA